MKIFFSVGEPSGDLHGANLIADLKRKHPDVECVGYGGPKMASAGCDLHEDLTQLAVMWFAQVFTNLHRFRALLRRAKEYFHHHRPDAVVLIDYPGFNWWIARIAKRYGATVYYYGPPQMWAWASWRIHKMRRLVDHVLCKLPFEAQWYAQRDCRAVYIGHPYFDEMERQTLDEKFLETRSGLPGPQVTILPGSRRQEVEMNLPSFLQAARLVSRDVPNVRFAVAAFNEQQAVMARAVIAGKQIKAGAASMREMETIEVVAGRTGELIQSASCCMATSGSVSLELLHHLKPTVIHYRINRLVRYVGIRWMVNVKFITLVNLLADEQPFSNAGTVFDPHAPGAENVPFPEFPTYKDESSAMASYIIQWLSDENERQRKIGQLRRLKEQYGASGASEAAAKYILETMSGSNAIGAPHFVYREGVEYPANRESV